ncbi:unnamed protein product [Mytilus edulis]|uniref:B box-type domain-containing protein n=1 Tax=Mytilus edulis TaxID=6550 RepID=A0A8S3RB83_MYTED|nr:unnamed protein product [Mytilus edulis]
MYKQSENTITHTRCKYHKDYYCTDVCLSCIKVICAKCRSERHTHHRLELIETFYQDKRIELLKCKSTLETHLQSQHAQATDEATLIKISEDLHLEHFEQEKQKVLKQAEDLKQRISERSHKLVDQLEESHQTYKSTTQNKFKLKITDQNLKPK